MDNILAGVGIGVAVAVAEVAMARNYEKDKHRLAAIAFHWLAISTLMPFLDFGVAAWMTGLFVGVGLTVPFVVVEIPRSRNAAIHTAVFAPVWGMVIAAAHQAVTNVL